MNIFKPIIDLFSKYIQFSPETLKKLDFEYPEIDHDGWYHAKNAIRMPAHESWFGHPSYGPYAIVWHYTNTKPGTAKTMAKNRLKKRNPKTDRAASWHFTIETDGTVVQMISAGDVAWHCAKGQIENTVTGVKHRVNHCAVGIELVSRDGTEFTDAQERAATELVEALKHRYEITKMNAGRNHSEFDPDRRRDAGPVWGERLARILNSVYGGA